MREIRGVWDNDEFIEEVGVTVGGAFTVGGAGDWL